MKIVLDEDEIMEIVAKKFNVPEGAVHLEMDNDNDVTMILEKDNINDFFN